MSASAGADEALRDALAKIAQLEAYVDELISQNQMLEEELGWVDGDLSETAQDRRSVSQVVVDADLWEWLRGSAHHDDGCNGTYKDPQGKWVYRCRCGFRDIAPRLDTAAVPVERYPNMSSSPYADVLWREVTR